MPWSAAAASKLAHACRPCGDVCCPEPGEVVHEVGEAAGPLEVLLDEGVAVGVRLEQAVPPREVQGPVVATVHMVDVMRLGGSSPGGQTHSAGEDSMEPKRRLQARQCCSAARQ